MTALHPVLTVRLFREQKCFGAGIVQLLQKVQVHHSLRAAALDMGMAYSKAWTVIRRSEEELGFQLLIYSTGGRNGGGAVVTPEAVAMLEAYERYCRKLTDYSEALFREEFREYLK